MDIFIIVVLCVTAIRMICYFICYYKNNYR